jgi:hypothetical protein
MLQLPISNRWAYVASNQSGGQSHTVIGTGVALGNGAEGSGVALLTITEQVDLVDLTIGGLSSSGSNRNAHMDFGWDPAGGTSYVWWLKDLQVGKATSFNANIPLRFTFPCRIPSGAQLAMRGYGSVASMTARVVCNVYGKPSRPELWRPAYHADTPGTYTTPNGIGFTPGNASWGSWVSLGTLPRAAFYYDVSINVSNATMNTEGTLVELAHGDTSNKHKIFQKNIQSGTGESLQWIAAPPIFCPLPAGAELFIRGNCSGAPATGYQALLHAFGG